MKLKVLKVKVYRCLKPTSWYADKVGQEFIVRDRGTHYVVDDNHPTRELMIDKLDCETIKKLE
jgi:hypothetical protein